MSDYFFSIITCTYNSDKYLQDNIDSLKFQIFKNFEHIFIDGNSTDKTIDILNRYQSENSNVKIIQTEPRGIANAMNIGIKNAQGKYLLFLNSDDFLNNENSLQNVFNFIKENPKYNWYYGIVDTITENKKYLYSYPHRMYQKIFCYWIFRFTFFMQHPATFYSRELFDKYGLYDETLNAMDYEYAIRIGKKEKAKFMNMKVSNFRLGGISTTQSDRLEKEVKKIFKKYFSFSGFWFLIRRFYIKIFVKKL